jgi:hypothetical protein
VSTGRFFFQQIFFYEGAFMKKLITLTALVTSALTAMAQPAKPTYAYYEGVNLSMGVAQNSTQVTTSAGAVTKGNTTLGVAKVNYTFALAYPAKLGVSASFDLKNSIITNDEYLSTTNPTEITIEPGLLLLSNSLLYAKLGTYSSRYESINGSRNLNGKSYGIGIKHYVYGQNFIQAEWTQRQPDSSNTGFNGDKFKQSSSAVYVGFNF